MSPSRVERSAGELPRLVLSPETQTGKILEFAPVSLTLAAEPLPEAVPVAGTEKAASPEPVEAAPALEAAQPVETGPLQPPASKPAATIPSRFVLSEGDVLDVHCFSEPSLSRERVVRTDGCIALPIVQDVVVAGLEVREAERRIREAYAGTFKQPQLTVTLKSAVRRSCAVLGGVMKPGRYACLDSMCLGSLIEQAGGLRARDAAGPSEAWLHKAIVVLPQSEDVPGHRVLGVGLESPEALDTIVPPGSVTVVAEPVALVYVLDPARGACVVQGRAGGVPLGKLLASGGVFDAPGAALRGVEVLRSTQGEWKPVSQVSAAVLLGGESQSPVLPGDLVLVMRKGAPEQTLSPEMVLRLRKQAEEAFYIQGLGLREFARIQNEEPVSGAEVSGRLDAAMGTLMNMLSGNP